MLTLHHVATELVSKGHEVSFANFSLETLSFAVAVVVLSDVEN
jgi:hypothetical protein